ncbi:glycosyltransferase family 2 protein [Chitinophaga sp. CB10]|uniref:glycosyltransferase family 2 protein n=1 Tax=Chitinophaga sp. CB10 TaxID=1891659 RepID=UPI0025BE8A47|nr:glycosyltransferase family 2 protein [Chitinophaga sp. CB10]
MQKFSVIIPVYNSEKTIYRAIKSVFEQNYDSFEIVVINDGSKDQSLSEINRAQAEFDKKDILNVITLPTNKGVSNARNTGWDNARGEYIAFLDADDTWHPEKLSYVNDVLRKNDIAMFCHYYGLPGDDITLSENGIKRISFPLFLLRNTFQTSCVIIKRTIPNRFNTEMSHCEDYDLLLKICYYYPSYYSKMKLTILGRPQLTSGGLSANKWKMRKGEMNIYKNLYKLNFMFLPVGCVLMVFSLFKHIFKLGHLKIKN